MNTPLQHGTHHTNNIHSDAVGLELVDNMSLCLNRTSLGTRGWPRLATIIQSGFRHHYRLSLIGNKLQRHIVNPVLMSTYFFLKYHEMDGYCIPVATQGKINLENRSALHKKFDL